MWHPNLSPGFALLVSSYLPRGSEELQGRGVQKVSADNRVRMVKVVVAKEKG